MKHDPAWYVAHVLTGTEQEIANRLKNAGMQALAPVEVLYERRRGKWWPVRKTLFPGYVFIHVEMSTRAYYYIKQMPNVIRLLGSTGPEPIPDEQMEPIHFFTNEGLDFGVSQGEKVEGKVVITAGPLKKLEGRIVKINARGRRATVAIPILGTTHQVDVGLIVSQGNTQQPDEAEDLS